MSAHPLTHMLPDLGCDASPGQQPERHDEPMRSAAEVGVDLAAFIDRHEHTGHLAGGAKPLTAHMLDSAYARGREDGHREAEALAELERAEREASLERKLEEARAVWAHEVGERLACDLHEAVRALSDALDQHIADILLPMLGDDMRARAVAALGEILAAVPGGQSSGPIVVSGPEDVLDMLGSHLGELAVAVTLVANDASDVRVELDVAVVQTQLSVWHETLRGLLP